jgi:hypothetical protein
MGILGFRRVTDAAILGALTALVTKHGRALTTGELASAPGVEQSRQGLLPRLERLAASGAVRRVPHADGSLCGWVPASASVPVPPPPPTRKVATETVAELLGAVARLVSQGITATCAALADILGWSRVWVRAVVAAAVALGRLFRGGARNAEVYPVVEAAVTATAQVAARRGFGATARDAARWMLARVRTVAPSVTFAACVKLIGECKGTVTAAPRGGTLLDARPVVAVEVCQ